MIWTLVYLVSLVAANVLALRWFYCIGIAKGRLLERIAVREASREERHLYVVRGKTWRDDGPGTA